MHTFLVLLETIVGLVLLWCIVQLALYLWGRKKNERYLTMQTRLNEAAKSTVREIHQVVAEDFKRARVDHRLKGDTAAELRSTAIKTIKCQLGNKGLREIRKVLGVHRKVPIDRILVNAVEAALCDLKILIKAYMPSNDDEVPPAPGRRFIPETIRMPRTSEEELPLYDEGSLHS